MKKIVLFSILLGFCFNAFSQSQSELLKSFSDKDLKVMKVTYDVGQPISSEMVKKPWPVKAEWNEGKQYVSKVIINRAGVVEEIFTPDITKYSSFFFMDEKKVTYMDGVFYYYENSKYLTLYTVNYLLAEDEAKLTKAYENLKKFPLLKEYLETTQRKQKEAKAEIAADIEKAKEEEYLKKSIKGKDISKIEIVWLSKDTETSLAKVIKYGIKATDKNGKEYKTSSLGGELPLQDFEITTDCEAKFLYDGLEAPLFCNSIKNDQITMTVKSKHHPNLNPASSSIKMAYSEGIQLDHAGKSSWAVSVRDGGHGGWIQVYVSESANKKLNLIEIKDFNGGMVGRLKLAKGVNLILHCNGANGKKAFDGKGSGNGGNGGNVNVFHKPGLGIDFITINNFGGNAGNGCCGNRGNDGKTNIVAQSVNLNF